ncbi:MAG: hypothetical protein QXH87_05745 [Candidatus Bathyarchaeia archaeon]
MFEYEEYETVQVKVPKAVLDFLRILKFNVQEYIEHTILVGFESDLETQEGAFLNKDRILKAFPELKYVLER